MSDNLMMFSLTKEMIVRLYTSFICSEQQQCTLTVRASSKIRWWIGLSSLAALFLFEFESAISIVRFLLRRSLSLWRRRLKLIRQAEAGEAPLQLCLFRFRRYYGLLQPIGIFVLGTERIMCLPFIVRAKHCSFV